MNETNTSSALPASAAPVKLPFVFPNSRQILEQAWAIYKQRMETLIAISLIPYALIAVAELVVGAVAIMDNNKSGPILIIAVLGIIVFAYLSVWGYAALLYNLSQPEQNLDFKQSYKSSSRYILPLIITGILYGLAVLGGMILLIIPGIIFAFWFGQSYFVVVTENLSGTKALKQSKSYVKNNLGQVFKKGLYLGIITIGLSILVSIAGAILGAVFGSKIFAHILNAGLNIFWTPLALAYSFLVFTNLKTSKNQSPIAPTV